MLMMIIMLLGKLKLKNIIICYEISKSFHKIAFENMTDAPDALSVNAEHLQL